MKEPITFSCCADKPQHRGGGADAGVHHGQSCAVECQDDGLQAEGQEGQNLGRASTADRQDS